VDIYIVILEDRHIDVEVTPFTTAATAIEAAQRQAHEACRCAEDYEENPEYCTDNWIFAATYSGEGDSVRVVKKTLQES
jgi:hypothetical protein